MLAVFESDDDYRDRALLFPETFSVAGPRDAYIYHGLSVVGVLDVLASSTSNGVVDVQIMSEDGVADGALIALVEAKLNDEKIRPLGTQLIVASAAQVDYTITATLDISVDSQSEISLITARAVIEKYTLDRFKIGKSIYLSAIYAALHQEGVETVVITTPLADIIISDTQFPKNTSIDISLF